MSAPAEAIDPTIGTSDGTFEIRANCALSRDVSLITAFEATSLNAGYQAAIGTESNPSESAIRLRNAASHSGVSVEPTSNTRSTRAPARFRASTKASFDAGS